MSLQFIAGEAGSGKTYTMHAQILGRAAGDRNRNFLILVPEQFNMQTQRDIVQKSPNKGIMNIDVLSFSRLAHRIFDEAGVSAGVMLGDTGKSMILRALASKHADELKILKGKLNKPGCIDELKSVISEMMQYDMSPGDIHSIAEDLFASGRISDALLAGKLEDIEYLYDRMMAYLKDKYIVPEELLDRAIRVMDKAAFLDDCEIYLDGYTGFTPVQLRFLGCLMRKCKRLVVTVTLGREHLVEGGFLFNTNTAGRSPQTELFSLGINMVRQLVRLALEEPAVPVEDPMTLVSQKRFSHVPEFVFLSERLFRPRPCQDGQTYNKDVISISIHEASDLRQEAEYVCRSVLKLVKEKKAGFGDIAVLTGDEENYGRFLMTEMVKYEIPFFIDERRSVSFNPLCELIGAIVDMTVTSYSYQSVFRFLKTGFAPFSGAEIMIMENYVLAAGIKRRTQYQKEWVAVPGEYEDGELIEQLNLLRRRFVALTEGIMEGFGPKRKDDVDHLIRTLYDFLEKLDIYGTFERFAVGFSDSGDRIRADEYRQMYGALISLMDQCVELLNGEKLSVGELGDILNSGLMEASVGILPPGADRVMIGDIERCRVGEIKYLFLMGVNDSIIPPDMKKSGLLSEIDRRLLEEKGLVLSESTQEAAFTQRFYLYMYLTKAKNGLFLSYSLSAPDGSRRIPSYLVQTLLGMFIKLKVERIPDTIAPENVYTEKEALYLLAALLRYAGEDEYRQLFSYFAAKKEYHALLRHMIDHAFRIYVHDPISKAAADALYGGILLSSISRLEQYASCPYEHFLNYGLRLKERRELSFEMRDLGSIYHRIIKVYFDLVKKETGGDWNRLEDAQKADLIQRSMDEVLSGGVSVTALHDSARSAYMENRIRRVMKKNLEVITYQIKQGDFSPVGTEYNFKNTDFKGTIDRLDVYRQGDEILLRVVDYKSGKNELDPTEVYMGKSLQLPLYLKEAALLLSKGYPEAVIRQAGMFYYHIHDPLIELSRDEEPDPEALETGIRDMLVLSGVLDGDPEVIRHMDRNLEGKSHVVKVTIKKDGQPDSRSQVAMSDTIEAVTGYAEVKARELAGEIKDGNIKVHPYRQGDRTACDWCRYSAICGFDEKVRGYEYNEAPDMTKEEALEAMAATNRI